MNALKLSPAIGALGLLIAGTAQASNIRSDIERNQFGCYDTVIFNNSNALVRGGRVDWRYDYADGGYNQGSTEVSPIAPGQRVNIQTFGAFDMSRCKTMKYNFKVLNWRVF